MSRHDDAVASLYDLAPPIGDIDLEYYDPTEPPPCPPTLCGVTPAALRIRIEELRAAFTQCVLRTDEEWNAIGAELQRLTAEYDAISRTTAEQSPPTLCGVTPVDGEPIYCYSDALHAFVVIGYVRGDTIDLFAS